MDVHNCGSALPLGWQSEMGRYQIPYGVLPKSVTVFTRNTVRWDLQPKIRTRTLQDNTKLQF